MPWLINILMDKTMDNVSTMMIHKITPSVDHNQWLKRLDTPLNEPTNQNSIKVPKIDKPTNKKMVIIKL